MNVQKFLDDIVIVAEWKHFIDEEHQGEVTSGLFEVRLYLELFPIIPRGELNQITTDVSAFDAGHGVEKVFY